MMTKLVTTIGMLLLAVKLAHPQAVDAMRRSTNFIGTDLIRVQTNSAGAAGQKFETAISGDNFLASLMRLDGWESSGGGAVTNAVLTNIVATGAATNVSAGLSITTGIISLNAGVSNLVLNPPITNINAITLHSNAVKYATERGLTNRQAMEDISGFFWTLQNNGLLSAFHDAAFLRGGQNAETNIAVRFTFRGSNGTSYASPVQTDKGILTGSGGGGYNFPTADLSTNFTLIFSGQTGAGGQTAYSHMISYTHATGSTNFGISIGHDVNNANVVVRSNNTTAVYAANYFGHLFTDYLRDDYPFPFTAGFGYQRSGLLTNWHNGYLGTNSSGNHPLSGLTLITVGSRLDDAAPGYAQSWKGTAHAWLLFNRQLSSNEVKNVEVALRWLAPTTHNEIAVGDSTSANIYTKQAESWSYQWFTGPGTNLGEYYIAAASGRSAVSMNSLWDDTVSRRKPQGKVKTATARIWAGINDIYAGGTGQATWETVSNMTVKAVRDGVGVEIATLYPSVAYDASMRVQWTNYNNQILSNANMFKKVYRRDLMFTVTNGVMWYDFLHLSTNGLAEVVKDMALGGQIGWGKALPTYPVGASSGYVLTSDANGGASWAAASGGGSTQMVVAAIGTLVVTNDVSVLGDGSTTPLITLSSPNGASFGLSVNTNLTVQTTNKFDFSSPSVGQVIAAHSSSDGQIVWTNATVSSGPTTNSPPQTLAINSGTGTTNIIIDWAALLSTNDVRVTLTAHCGIVHTNVIDGKYITLETIQDSPGFYTCSTNISYPHNTRFGTDITGYGLSTNGGYRDKIRFYGSGTNAQVVGMLRGYAP